MADVESSWAARELPILRVALRRLDAGADMVNLAEVATETGLTPEQVWTGIRALEAADPPYLTTTAKEVLSVSERARRELGSWPSPGSVVDDLVEALGRAAEKETEPEAKGRLRAAADALAGMARDVAVAVIAKRLGDI